MQRLHAMKAAGFVLLRAGFYGVAVAFIGALGFVPVVATISFMGLLFLLFALPGFVVMVLQGGFCWAIALAFLQRSRVWWLAAVAGALP